MLDVSMPWLQVAEAGRRQQLCVCYLQRNIVTKSDIGVLLVAKRGANELHVRFRVVQCNYQPQPSVARLAALLGLQVTLCVSSLCPPPHCARQGTARNSKLYLQEQVLAQCTCNVTANRQQVINLFGDVKEAETKGAQVC